MTDFTPERPHPLGLIDNPEWKVSLTRRAELYLAERARRDDPEREPTSLGPAVAILAVIAIGVAFVSFLVGAM